ncbi:hypothetical protein [Levilactobacillus cerevisiae]|uniref:hypothetical protein n=1 Tax=Levilactobacillus cerevisiae TaxID=1704076 RepID=UPI0013DDD454|nr:hypothetical protein [Levilactobacillus cerevisiae]
MSKKDEENGTIPGVHVHPKKYSSSGGLADWGPLLEWAGGLFKALWKQIQRLWSKQKK